VKFNRPRGPARPLSAATLLIAVAVLVTVVLPMPVTTQTLVLKAGGFALAALGLVVMMGFTGMISLSQAAFMAFGAYGVGLALQVGWSFWEGAIIGVVAATVVSALIGLMSIRLGLHYLAMLTIAVQVLFVLFLTNSSFTGGSNGLSGIARPAIAGLKLTGGRAYLVFVAIIVGICSLSVWLLARSKLGRAMKATREDRTAADIVGVHTYRIRVISFAISGAFAAAGGVLYAGAYQYISPTDFQLGNSITILAIAIIGGLESVPGAIVGSLLLIFLPQWLEFLGDGYLLIYGLAIIVFVTWRSDGIVGSLVNQGARVARRWYGQRTDARNARIAVRNAEWSYTDDESQSGAGVVGGDFVGNSTEQPASLSVNGLSMHFGGVRALDDVDIVFGRGIVHGVLGPNGSGKTTLLNVMSGLYRPTAGKVECDGVYLGGKQPHEIAERGLCRTFQLTRLFKDLSVFENVAVGAEVGARRIGDVRGAKYFVKDALEFVGLGEVTGHKAGYLSYGQQRYVEIARALATQPRVILLDEPGAGINSAEKAVLENVLEGLCDRGITVVLVEHDIEFVRRIATRITVLDFGRVIADGLADPVMNERAVREAYLGVEV
jgi:branched-chain amino acid transport system permease protein